MFEAYSVGVTLRLHDLVSPQLTLLTKEFEKLDLLTGALSKSLKAISVDSTGLRALATATNSTNRAFERATVAAGAYESRLAAIHRLGGAMGGGVPRLPGIGGGGSGGYHGRGGFHGGNVHMGPGGIGLGTVGMAAGDAFVPLAVTAGLLYAGKSLFESAKDLDTERQRFKLFGLSDAQNSEAFKFAAGMRVYGSTEIENLRNFREAQGVFREAGLGGSEALSGAKLAAPILSKLNALDGSLDDESASRSAASNLAMLRFVESAGGLKSQTEFNRLANIGYRLKVGSGDTVDWQQLQQFEKTGGSSVINMTGEGLARIEPSISTLGGGRVGTSLATGFGRLEGIIRGLPVPVIDELLKSGVWDKSKVELNSRGGVAKFLDPHGPMSAGMSKLLSENPEGFYEQVIRPVYAKMNLDAAGVIRQNALIYGRTGGALANEWEKQLGTIEKAVAAFQKTLDISAATAKLPDSITGQEKEFEAAWTDFKTQFGTTVLPLFTGILKGGASIFRHLNDNQHFPNGREADDLFWQKHNGGSGQRYDWSAPSMFGNPLVGRSPFIGADAKQPINITVQSVLDGRVIAESTAQHFGDSANGSQTGIETLDPTQSLIQAGGGIHF
jgi:hypothetical protein